MHQTVGQKSPVSPLLRIRIQRFNITQFYLIMVFILILGLLLFSLITWVVFKHYSGYRFTKAYAKYAKSLGLKVYEVPFYAIGFSSYREMKKQEEQYGDSNYNFKTKIQAYDIALSNSLSQTLIELIDPQLIKEFYMKANDGYYIKRLFGFGEVSRLISKDNLLLSEGSDWKNRRKLFSEIFNYDFIKQKIPDIQRICRNKINQMEDKFQVGEGVYTYQVTHGLIHAFSEVILECFFKTHEVREIDGVDMIDFLNKLLEKLTMSARMPMSVAMGPRMTKRGLRKVDREINEGITKFRAVARTIIEKRIQQIELQKESSDNSSKDIVETLMKGQNLKKSGEETENSITVDTLINEFATFIIAGSQTTMSFTRMMIYELAMHPEVLTKLKEEISREITTDQPQYQDLKKLKYLECVQKEVLRMDSSVSMIFPRIVVKEHYIGKLKIEKGMQIGARIRAVQFKESVYGDPLVFRPERWLQPTNSPYSYIPFSAGARNCIGNGLALLQNKIYMIELLRRYKTIKIDKERPKMRVTTFYGPEPVQTTFSKF